MGVPSMPLDWGVLFDFGGWGARTMWTKRCKFPLDIVWLDDDAGVIAVAMLPPETITRGHFCHAVLELNAGVAAENGLVPGARLGISWAA